METPDIEFEVQICQDGEVMASVYAANASDALREASHYAHTYGQDRYVEVKLYERRKVSIQEVMQLALGARNWQE